MTCAELTAPPLLRRRDHRCAPEGLFCDPANNRSGCIWRPRRSSNTLPGPIAESSGGESERDIELTRRALERSHVANELVVVQDGQEALDYLFGTGAHAGREVSDLPSVTLLDLKLPRVPGLEVLRAIRADPRTRRTPVVILTSSN